MDTNESGHSCPFVFIRGLSFCALAQQLLRVRPKFGFGGRTQQRFQRAARSRDLAMRQLRLREREQIRRIVRLELDRLLELSLDGIRISVLKQFESAQEIMSWTERRHH